MGAGRGAVAYAGKTFSLTERQWADWKKRYYAVPDFLAAIQTLDAELADKPQNKVYGALQTKLLNKHEFHLRIKAERSAKTGARWNNAGKRVV